MRSGIDRLNRRITELRDLDVRSILQRSDPRVIALETAIEECLERVFGAGTIEVQRYHGASMLHYQIASMSFAGGGVGGPSPIEVQIEFTKLRDMSIALLEQAVRGLHEELAEQRQAIEPMANAPVHAPSNKVFVVHGRDEGSREAVARFLERIGFEPVILHEQANQSRTVIEKIEAHSDVGFAVVLLTPDDEGSLKGEAPQPRARQNVLLELGYFIGKLTRKRVCTLKVGDLEIPSDWGGVIDEPFDGAWKQTLARELQSADYKVDWNKVMR
jgi:predicted nucleotide-binding protein